MSNYVEVGFKANRRDIYTNPEEYPLKVNDYVILRADKGIDIGCVYRLLNDYTPCEKTDTINDVLRKASKDDLMQMEENRKKEEAAKPIAKELFKKHELNMKLTEVEYQLDANKITFYFTADERVDFRELVKDLAQQFKARIELRQISSREAARKLGGCGKCGLPLCCTTCIVKEFMPISTQCAKEQMLSTNPSKLTGICERLRCCLRFELPIYVEALKKYPQLDSIIKTPAGNARIEKIDIFKEIVHLRYDNEITESLPYKDVQLLLAN